MKLMKPFLAVLVLCPYFGFSAWSQTTTPPPQQPLPQLRQFLGLTDVQVSAILQNNDGYNRFSFQQQDAIRQAQSQIAVETAKDPLDPMALGTLYAGIESACRELRDRAASSQKQNISILTDAQKAKLNVLNDAMKLIPTISEAQLGNLLGSTNSPPFAFSAFSSGIITGVTGFPPVSGCASPFPFPNVVPANPLAPVAPIGTSQPGVGTGVFRVGGGLPGSSSNLQRGAGKHWAVAEATLRTVENPEMRIAAFVVAGLAAVAIAPSFAQLPDDLTRQGLRP